MKNEKTIIAFGKLLNKFLDDNYLIEIGKARKGMCDVSFINKIESEEPSFFQIAECDYGDKLIRKHILQDVITQYLSDSTDLVAIHKQDELQIRKKSNALDELALIIKQSTE